MAEREIMIGGRRLSQLKVDELKVELERRGLRKSGNKGVLIERLQEVMPISPALIAGKLLLSRLCLHFDLIVARL